MNNKYCYILWLIIFYLSSVSAQEISASEEMDQISNLEELKIELSDMFNDPNFTNSFWGVHIQSLKTGETFFKINSDKLFVPASVIKLFTSASALLLLGSDYMYKTTIYTDGIIKGGTLHGNIIIKGSGDPTISNRFIDGDVNIVFRMWADSLKQLGVEKIEGNIIGDDDNFDETRLGKGWSHEIVNNWFAPPSGALCYNDNSIGIEVKPTSPGLPAEVSIKPEYDYKLINKVYTASSKNEPKIEVVKKKGSHIIHISGLINAESSAKKLYVTIDDPTDFFLFSLFHSLKEEGIEITGFYVDKDDESVSVNESNLTPLFSHYSAPLSKLITEVNKNSNNFYSEQIFRTIGYELLGFGDIQNSLLMTKDIRKRMGINPENMLIVDGSGLSRLNLVTPNQVVKLLSYLHKSDEFGTFFESLPIAGVDGTLANRFKKSAAENNIRAKPGFLENIRSFAGYLKTADDEPLVFCIIVNNFLVPSQLANYLQDKVCTRLVNFSRN